ncbi:molybdopterin-dependent oxidoreductase [Salisediminibacterium halotolerans]|uniref:molybdopterin-dependent oxidoreductase n=1 Tax=Salisediminibacterium halotolerans TaxID=517425 RepID=UPI000EB3A218|nr:molybdopterin-dependent oxidoreductase [Salisediminibacterium halotolerans]RLJ75734.1 anaerobic dimethyl sulfoxide reductase subunit A [Actinophytocola xinjiangensis]RPE89588.1 anaerobic dimethyl sulfoxide reductase subunit A [Salisediminibacterium halotolerans]TWG36347.1 anaerobic dimethyl sulfoxide reductase subunit A [Salisediminibacterium halotolerans]GEL09203.1 dimethyl sulfoxide reductase subunit A [Salisediminibacterium halotolerans]
MFKLLDKLENFTFSRRAFLGSSAAVTAGALLPSAKSGLRRLSAAEAAEEKEQNGEWIPAACWHNCGGRCLLKAYVEDGVVKRQKTDDTVEDTADNPQQRSCVRGQSQRQQVYGVDRLKYPMKRKHWQPGGGDKSLRGHDEWERISWDEALDTIAGEIERIKNDYGNRSIMVTGGDVGRALNLAGGHTTTWGTTSWGSWRWGPEYFGLQEGYFEHSINDRMDLRNSQLIVLWGMNPAWSSPGSPSYHFLQAKKEGARVLVIDPMYSETAELMGDEWIPVHPGTDHALMLGMAHTLVDEDDPETNPLIDWEFLQSCTVGFDEETMPEDADKKENFKAYLTGEHDGEAKDAEWASKISGVDADKIREIAREIGTTNRVALLTGWAPARIKNSDSWPQMFMTFGAMTGNMAEPGKMTGVSCHFGTGNGGPRLVYAGASGVPAGAENPVEDSLAHAEMWDAILQGKYTAGEDDVRDIDIKMIYHGNNAALQTRDGQTKGIDAHREMEFVVTNGHFITTNAKYSDIVLPATTHWERFGGFNVGNRDALFYYRNVIEPMYEARDDAWITTEIGKRLGFTAEEVYGDLSKEQELFNQIAGAEVMKEDGSEFEPLVTITEEDIKEWGVDGEPQEGRMTIAELEEKGVYTVKRSPGDNLGYIAQEEFRKDPDNNPLDTESGKLEIHSKALADYVRSNGFTTIDPIPTYNPATEGYEETYKDFDAGKKGDYPLQVVNPHYLRRAHTIFDNNPWLREAWPNDVYVSREDADKRGVADGDPVLITSKHGKTLRTAHVTERLMPGVVGLMHGAWVEKDAADEVDRAGSDNILTGAIPTGQGISGWNSTVCDFEKWDGGPLKEDKYWEPRVVL